MNIHAIDHLIAANFVLLMTDVLVAFAISGLTVKGMIDRNPSRRTIRTIIIAGAGLWIFSFALATAMQWSPLDAAANWHPFVLPLGSQPSCVSI